MQNFLQNSRAYVNALRQQPDQPMQPGGQILRGSPAGVGMPQQAPAASPMNAVAGAAQGFQSGWKTHPVQPDYTRMVSDAGGEQALRAGGIDLNSILNRGIGGLPMASTARDVAQQLPFMRTLTRQ